MTVPRKPYKKKNVTSCVPIIEKKEYYADIQYSNKNVIDTNHTILQIPKEELAEIFQSTREVFHMKVTIWKSEKDIKYALPDSYFKVDQESDLFIIYSWLIKRLKLKVKPIKALVPNCLGMSDTNGHSIELKSWATLWIEVFGIHWAM